MIAALAAPALASAQEAPRGRNRYYPRDDWYSTGVFAARSRRRLDALAKDGARFVNFYTHATAHHRPSAEGVDTTSRPGNIGGTGPTRWPPGYEGYLNARVLPAAASQGRATTYMVGKWPWQGPSRFRPRADSSAILAAGRAGTTGT